MSKSHQICKYFKLQGFINAYNLNYADYNSLCLSEFLGLVSELKSLILKYAMPVLAFGLVVFISLSS